MPLISKKQAVKLLQPYLAESLNALIEARDKRTGCVRVPLGELTVVQDGAHGVKQHRGKAIKFYDWQVNDLLKLLQAREEAQRQQQARRSTLAPTTALAIAAQIERDGDKKGARFLRRLAAAQTSRI